MPARTRRTTELPARPARDAKPIARRYAIPGSTATPWASRACRRTRTAASRGASLRDRLGLAPRPAPTRRGELGLEALERVVVARAPPRPPPRPALAARAASAPLAGLATLGPFGGAARAQALVVGDRRAE